MKVVYNDQFGGFGLNQEALARYAKAKGKDPKDIWVYDIDRTDPDLVKVVEETKDAGDSFSSLNIIDIPEGSIWRIDEYDGNERVMTISDYDWKIAT